MSITRYELKDGSPRWRVKTYGPDGKQQYATFTRRNDAVAYKAEQRRNKGASPDTLAAHFEEVWNVRWEGSISPNTAHVYRNTWNKHIKPALGDCTLAELWDRPQIIDAWAAGMRQNGVGNAARLKAIKLLSTVLTVAVRWRKISSNPCDGLERPSGRRARTPVVVQPLQVERLCSRLNARDARMVCLMAYCGLRPSEMLVLTGADFHGTHLVVDKAGKMKDGSLGGLKNQRAMHARSVPLLPVVRELLGDLPRRAKLFPSSTATESWCTSEWDKWCKHLQRAAARHQVPLTRPYDLRHTYVSLLVRSGLSIPEVAAQAGHSPAVCLATYTHIFNDLDPYGERDVDALIRAAVAEVGVTSLSHSTVANLL